MSSERPSRRELRPDDSFARGVAYLILGHFLQLPMTWLVGGISLAFIGVSQLLYFIPMLIVFVVKKQSETAKGLSTAAAITFLLNATCAGILFKLITSE